jgi:Xaa-Pro dipeptidase
MKQNAATGRNQTVDPTFHHDEYEVRYQRLQAALEESDLDVFLSFTPENIYYMTGFHTPGYYFPQCLVVPRNEAPTLVVRNFELPGVERLTWLENGRGFKDHERPAQAIADTAVKFPGSRIGYESDSWFLTPALLAEIENGLGEATAIPVRGLIERQRVVKSSAEVELMRLSARHTDAGMAAAFAASQVGATENDVAGRIYQAMIVDGSSYPSLPPFVAVGPRSADPHATWSGRPLNQGDLLYFEVGGSQGRYGSGLIRMGSVGEPPNAHAETISRAMTTVTAALEALLETIRPGVSSEAVNRASRQIIEGEGWGDANRTRAGYSIGISFPPDWGEGHILALREDEHRELQAGMVFHIVPNVLLPGVGGVGLSETVLVTDDGCECLTQFPRDFVVTGND